MSLRLRLFSLVGALVLVLIAAQWIFVRSLTADLSVEVGEVAVWAGSSVARFLSLPEACGEDPDCIEEVCQGEDCDQEVDQRVEVIRFERSGSSDPTEFEHRIAHLGQGPARAAETEGPHAVRIEIRTDETEPQRIDRIAKFLVNVEADRGSRYLALKGPHVERHIPIPVGGLESRLESFSQRLVAGSFALLGVGFVLAGVIAHRASRPLLQLADASRRVGGGELGTRVESSAGGEVGAAIAAFNGMSDRLVELDRHNRELQATRHLGEIGEIARGLAHSLRNPLNALGLSVEELGTERGPDHESEERSRVLVSSARRQIRRLDRSLQAFLALASEGGGRIVETSVGDLVRDVALEALQDCRGRVRVEVNAEPHLATLEAIEPELRAVLHALVTNAIEASEESGASDALVEIEVGAGVSTSHRVEVRDRGPGLPVTVRENLFTPHVSTKATGSGMGLYLAHRVATSRYDGDLELLDREHGGTRAVLDLDARLASPDDNGSNDATAVISGQEES